MKTSAFTEGVEVQYKSWIGRIRFVCDEYVTICVGAYGHRSRDVCLLVYRSQLGSIKLLKESDK